jgi:cation diffusion facilitator CzcD-associated flavoprotein CzcO
LTINKTDHLIVGAGPGGLAMAAHFKKAGLDFELIEKSEEIAHRWHNHYDRLLLHTVRDFSSLPFKDFPADYPTYIPKEALIKYYEDYASAFEISVNYNTNLDMIYRNNNVWNAQCSKGEIYQSKHVIIATGANRTPNFPHWNNIEDYQREILHSRYYKNAKLFQGKKVLIVGFGNTGAEIALDLAEHDIDVSISVRSPVIIVPRDVLGRPVQKTAKLLDRLPYPVGDWIGTQIRKLVFGDLSKYGIPMSKEYPLNYLKKTGKTPIIDLGTVDMIKRNKIKILPDIDSMEEDGVLLKNGEIIHFDTIILCTGYRPDLEHFLPHPGSTLNHSGYPISPIGSGENKGLYFIGFDVRSLGGILGTIPRDAQIIMNHIHQQL